MLSIACAAIALTISGAAAAQVGTLENPIYTGELKLQGNIPDVIINQPNYGDEPLPASWDWRALGLMSTDLNQHIPVYW